MTTETTVDTTESQLPEDEAEVAAEDEAAEAPAPKHTNGNGHKPRGRKAAVETGAAEAPEPSKASLDDRIGGILAELDDAIGAAEHRQAEATRELTRLMAYKERLGGTPTAKATPVALARRSAPPPARKPAAKASSKPKAPAARAKRGSRQDAAAALLPRLVALLGKHKDGMRAEDIRATLKVTERDDMADAYKLGLATLVLRKKGARRGTFYLLK